MRRIKRKNVKQRKNEIYVPISPMKYIKSLEVYQLENTIYGNYSIGIISYNSLYFHSGLSLLSAYNQFIIDFVAFENEQKRLVRIIEFLKYSIKNSQLNDYVSYIDFNIEKNHIIFQREGSVENWINMGELISDDYQINCCGSYMFFTDLRTNEQFMYYGD